MFDGHPDGVSASNRIVPVSFVRPIVLSGQQAALVASVLLLTAGAAYLAVLRAEERNPRRLFLQESWTRIPIDASEVTAFQAMGPPDQSTNTADESCAREHVWYEWSQEQTGRAYRLCADHRGVIRSKDVGVAFNLTTW